MLMTGECGDVLKFTKCSELPSLTVVCEKLYLPPTFRQYKAELNLHTSLEHILLTIKTPTLLFLLLFLPSCLRL